MLFEIKMLCEDCAEVVANLDATATHALAKNHRPDGGAVSRLALKRDGIVKSPSRFGFLFAHDLFGKLLHTFPNHALPHQHHRIAADQP